jgi:hypothetical protein
LRVALTESTVAPLLGVAVKTIPLVVLPKRWAATDAPPAGVPPLVTPPLQASSDVHVTVVVNVAALAGLGIAK